MTGSGLPGERALQGAAEQGHGLDYIDFKVYVIAFVLVIAMVFSMCSMYPGRRLRPQRRSGERGGQASSSSRRAPGDDNGGRGSEEPTRRWRTTSREREEVTDEMLHRR